MELKKRWQKPQLIVIARGTPEENVLRHCKRIDKNGGLVGAEVASQTSCDMTASTNCGACQARASS